jgi:hypothetical protein
MDKPKIWDETNELELPLPSNWSIEEVLGQDIVTSLSGQDMIDTSFGKYQLNLDYDTIFVAEYEAIKAFLLNARNNNLKLFFRWDKFSEFADTYRYVNIALGGKNFIAGSGETGYLVSTKVTVKDVSAR